MPDAPESPPVPSPSPPRRGVVNPEVLRLDESLVGKPLAAPWQRAGGMAIDLAVLGALSLLAGGVLGLATGATLAALAGRRGDGYRAWLVFRWLLLALGAVVIVLSGFLLADRPLVRTTAFNLGRIEARSLPPEPVVPPAPSMADLRRAVAQLEEQNAWLRAEIARLREATRGHSWLNTASDFSRTLGLTFGWSGVYFTLVVVVLRGRTVGKLIFRTRVVRLDGRPLTAMDAFVRNGGYAAGLATGMIGFLRLLWDPNRQAIQDKIASTVVIRA